LLFYVVYTCQKSFNFINAFACYMQKCKLAPFNLANGCIRWIKNINIKSFLGNGTKLHSVQLLIHSPPGCQISSKSPNRTIFGVVMMICRFSRWRPLRRTFTSGFGLGADPLFRMSVSISKTKFCRNISIRGWDIAIHGLKKQTSAILEFYFRLQFGPYVIIV